MKKINRKLADIGHHRVEYVTDGDGQPVVVLISGYGVDMDRAWPIYDAASKLSTVFAYNRVGYGASSKSNESQSGTNVVKYLRSVLKSVDLRSPYILIGHSIGAHYANLFARQFPAEVCGVILIDPTPLNQEELQREHPVSLVENIIDWIMNKLDAIVNSTRHSELASFNETLRQIEKSGPFPNIPLYVVCGGKRATAALTRINEKYIKHCQGLADISPQGQCIVAWKSGHYIQNDEPDIILTTINGIINQYNINKVCAR